MVRQLWIIQKPLETSGNRPRPVSGRFPDFFINKNILKKNDNDKKNRKPTGNLPETYRKPTGNLPETAAAGSHKKMVNSYLISEIQA